MRSTVRKDPRVRGLGETHMTTGSHTPVLQAVGRPSMGPLVGSLEQQRQGQPGIRDVKTHTKTWAWLCSENHYFQRILTMHMSVLTTLTGAAAHRRRVL
jgi:hypothetical protein